MGRESYDLIFEFSREGRDIFATLHMSQTCFRKKISQFVALHAFRGHRVAHDESIGSANVSICLTDVEPSLPNVSPPLRPPFRIPAIFPSTTRDCLSYPIEKLTIFDSFRENFNLKRLLTILLSTSYRYSMVRERERDEGENFNLAEPVEPELNLICPSPSIWIDRSIG